MKSLSISLPEAMVRFIEYKVKTKSLKSPSEYVQALINEARRREAGETLEKLVLEGLNSGAPVEVDAEFWNKRRDVLKTHLEE
jgi:Arc/MetJ-type ribon-helix-helix transcriptional regulator